MMKSFKYTAAELTHKSLDFVPKIANLQTLRTIISLNNKKMTNIKLKPRIDEFHREISEYLESEGEPLRPENKVSKKRMDQLFKYLKDMQQKR